LARNSEPYNDTVRHAVRFARRLVVGVIGSTVVLLGLIMIFTPGPAMILIPLGLAILGIEFAWARHLLRKVRENFQNATGSQWKKRKKAEEEANDQ